MISFLILISRHFKRYVWILITLSILSSCDLDFSSTDEESLENFSERPVKPQFGDEKIGERSIHYAHIDQGKDVLLVFIHGSPGAWSAFEDYFKEDSLLAFADMVAIDRPGFGYSDPGWPEPSMEQQAAMMQAVLERFSEKEIFLIGHSLGGPVIARMAMDFPEKYAGLLYLAPSIDPDLEKGEWYRSWIKTKVVGALTPWAFWVSNEEIVPLKQELTDMIPLWKNVITPSMVIQGTEDQFVPKENAEFARNMMPDSLVEIRYLEGANHFIPWSHYPEILEGIMDLTGK